MPVDRAAHAHDEQARLGLVARGHSRQDLGVVADVAVGQEEDHAHAVRLRLAL